MKNICGKYEYRFYYGPSTGKVELTIHNFEDNGLASVATISWKGNNGNYMENHKSWNAFKIANSGRLFGFDRDAKTWKIRCCEFLYYTITEGNLEKDGLTLIG